jgi:hypothetical protein
LPSPSRCWSYAPCHPERSRGTATKLDDCGPPDDESVRAAKPSRFISKTLENANDLHRLEVSVDITNTSYLHNNRLGDCNGIRNRDGAPQIEVVKTGYGLF